MFIASPFFAITGMVTYPDPNTIALGGVATGSMKAQDAAIAAGTIIKSAVAEIGIASVTHQKAIKTAIAAIF